MQKVGTIRFKLAELMDARGWSAYRLSQESGVQEVVIAKFKNNVAPSPRLETLARLCGALGCGIGDLMEYVPDKGRPKASARSKKR